MFVILFYHIDSPPKLVLSAAQEQYIKDREEEEREKTAKREVLRKEREVRMSSSQMYCRLFKIPYSTQSFVFQVIRIGIMLSFFIVASSSVLIHLQYVSFFGSFSPFSPSDYFRLLQEARARLNAVMDSLISGTTSTLATVQAPRAAPRVRNRD